MAVPTAVEEFLALRRIAVVGVSRKPKEFANLVYEEFRKHGYAVFGVNPQAQTVSGDPCYPSIAAIPGGVDAVVVMVPASAALDVVREAYAAGVRWVWLHRGVGRGAVSPEAVAYAEDNGMRLVAGVCPFMFLPPVAAFHRLHRGMRRMTGGMRAA